MEIKLKITLKKNDNNIEKQLKKKLKKIFEIKLKKNKSRI